MVFLPLLVPLVLVVVVAGLVFAAGPLASRRGRGGGAVLAGVSPPLVVAGVIVVTVVGLGALGGLPSTSSDDEPSDVVAPTTAPSISVPEPNAAPIEGLGPIVRLRPDDGLGAVGRLQPGTVLRMEVEGFDPHAVARAEQCVSTGERRCGNPIPVQFGANGSAAFQYLVTDGFTGAAEAGRCRLTGPPCSIVVTAMSGAGTAKVATVFHDPVPPPGRIEVTPSRGIGEGHEVTVELEGFQPRIEVKAELCALSGGSGPEQCGEPGPTSSVRLDGRGRGRTTLVVEPGPVGSERIPCDRSNRCAVAVTSSSSFARAEPVAIAFAKPPGVDYHGGRLAAGLAAALVLLLAAGRLIRTTDWAPIGEAAAPEIDDAVYADLDAIIALLPPEDEDALV